MNDLETSAPTLTGMLKNTWHPVLGVIVTIFLNTKYDVPLWYAFIVLFFYIVCFFLYHIIKAYRYISLLLQEIKNIKINHQSLSSQYEEKNNNLEKEKLRTLELWRLAESIAFTSIKSDRIEKLKIYKGKIL